MRRMYMAIGACLLWAACTSKKKELARAMHDPAVRQEKELHKVKVVATYMPACWKKVSGQPAEQGDELTFRLQVFPDKYGDRQTDNNAASFGTDTLFSLVTGGDTLAPIYSHRIANGNLSGVEYLVAFDRSATGTSNAMRLVYKDWLFTSARFEFFYERVNTKKVDDLSCSL